MLSLQYHYNIKENIFDVMTKNKRRNFEEELLLKYLGMSSKIY